MKHLRNKLFILFLLLNCIFGSVANAQKFKEHNWFKASAHTIIPDSLMDEDAVMIYNKQFIYNDIIDITNGKFSSKKTVMQKVKILTEKGLDKYSKVFVNLSPGEKIVVVDARTIKPNGNVVDFKTDDIKKLTYKSPYYTGFRFQQLRFSIPDVEVGDEVEIVYTLKSRDLSISGDVILHTYLPCLQASLKYGASKAFVHEFKMYNGMPMFTDNSDQVNLNFSWALSNLPSINDQPRAIYTKSIPFVRYVIRKYVGQYQTVNLAQNSWDNVYKRYNDAFNDKSAVTNKKKHLRAFVHKFRLNDPLKTNEELFEDIHQYIYDNIRVRSLTSREEDHLLTYYLENKIIDNHNLYVLYNELFKVLGIKHFICFGRNKYEGDLDVGYVAPHILDYVYYSYYDDSSLKFVYPSNNYKKYLLGELPISVRGTKIIMLAPASKKSNFSESVALMMPLKPSEVNKKVKQLFVEVDNLEDSAFQIKSQIKLSGVFSTIYRESNFRDLKDEDYSFYSKLLLARDVLINKVEVDSVNNKFPYNYSLSAAHVSPFEISKIDDNVYSIAIDQLLNVSNLYVSTKKRTLNYFTRYLYTDQSEIIFQFKNKVKLENIDVLKSLTVKNTFGAIIVDVAQLDDLSIKLSISYQVNSPYLNRNRYNNIIDLDEAFQNLLSQKIIFTTLN